VVAFRSGQRDGVRGEISTCHQEKRWPGDRHERVHAGQVSRLWPGAAVNEVSTLGVGDWGAVVEDDDEDDDGTADGAVDGDVDGSAPWFELPEVAPELVGVAAGLDGGVVVGSLVGDGDCDGDEDGLDVWLGEPEGDVDGEPDVVVGDGDGVGECVEMPAGDAVDVGQSVEELPG
jgi:hypothetical protein